MAADEPGGGLLTGTDSSFRTMGPRFGLRVFLRRLSEPAGVALERKGIAR
jgi:hypothetical protein